MAAQVPTIVEPYSWPSWPVHAASQHFRVRFALGAVAFGPWGTGMAVSSTAVALDGFGATRFSSAVLGRLGTISSDAVGDELGARVVSAAMVGGSAAITSGAMRDGFDFSAESPPVGGSAATNASGAVVEEVAETVASDAVLVSSGASAAIAPPVGPPPGDAMIAASTYVLDCQ